MVATLSSQSPVQGSPISVATVTDGGNDVLASATYQWKVNTGGGFVNATGTGATTATYTPTEADEGGTLEVVVTYTDPGNAGGKETTTVTAANAMADSSSLSLVFSGTLKDGSKLTAAAAAIADADDTGASIYYQWQNSLDGSSWNNIGGANSSTYILSVNDANKFVRVRGSFTDDTGQLVSCHVTRPAPAKVEHQCSDYSDRDVWIDYPAPDWE